jgi:hypothetical protein
MIGVFPIRDHYYEPMFNPVHLKRPLNDERKLPGIDWNIKGQLELLELFDFNQELQELPKYQKEVDSFYYDNLNFVAGDAEFFYNMIRLHKPKRIIEIGSGISTMLAHTAIKASQRHYPEYHCRHLCIEPYEMPWLENLDGIDIIRNVVEQVDQSVFTDMESGDILFIDSSHVIRPQGDVLTEYLEILPILKPGVFIHVHDIFSPRDYPKEWLVDQVRLWNEQYLLEAFLSCNKEFEIIGALNYLRHSHKDALAEKCPIFALNPDLYEPGSFWIKKI